MIFDDNFQVGNFQELNSTELHSQYITLITEHVGLESFDQLVFLQHFVLTFDERRDLLFWNERVLERSLYLAFGVSPEEAKQADNLRKEYEDADSNVRNYNWEATQLRNKIQELESQRDAYQTTASATYTDIKEKHHLSIAASCLPPIVGLCLPGIAGRMFTTHDRTHVYHA